MHEQKVTLLEKRVAESGDVEYHFDNGRVRKYGSEAAALREAAASLANTPYLAEVLAVILDQRAKGKKVKKGAKGGGGVVEGKTVVVDAHAPESLGIVSVRDYAPIGLPVSQPEPENAPETAPATGDPQPKAVAGKPARQPRKVRSAR